MRSEATRFVFDALVEFHMPVTFGKAKELVLKPSFVVSGQEELELLQEKYDKFKRRFEIANRVENAKFTTVVLAIKNTMMSEVLTVTVFGCEVRLKDPKNLRGTVYNVDGVTFNFTDGESVTVRNMGLANETGC